MATQYLSETSDDVEGCNSQNGKVQNSANLCLVLFKKV